MSLVSFQFILFISVGCIIYYLVPKKIQWIVLLFLSYCFYLSGGRGTVVYILVTTITVWGCGILLEYIDQNLQARMIQEAASLGKEGKKAIKAKSNTQRRFLFWGVLIVNFGILAYLKYANFFVNNINRLLGAIGGNQIPQLSDLILPLGISFYTFQTISYLIDIYWGRIKAEKNILHFALYVSFFPQIVQGPISRYQQLAVQFYEKHEFDLRKMESAALLMLWGYFKKMVISNRAIAIVNAVFDFPENYGGAITVFAVLVYSLQQYADFSGGIDIITGVAELFGIELTKNFKRPYFSTSLADFWRRWHISLGAWMRDYVFYPLAMTKGMGRLRRFVKARYGEEIAKVCPGAICNIVVFLIVGLWHGAHWHCIVWGLYNGIILAISTLMEPFFVKVRTWCHVEDKSIKGVYKLFCIFRTFIIVNFGWFFDRAQLSNAAIMIKNVFTNFCISELSGKNVAVFGLIKRDYIFLLIAAIIIFAVSLFQEKKNCSVREFILNKPLVIRWSLLYAFIFFFVMGAVLLGGTKGDFMYAQF